MSWAFMKNYDNGLFIWDLQTVPRARSSSVQHKSYKTPTLFQQREHQSPTVPAIQDRQSGIFLFLRFVVFDWERKFIIYYIVCVTPMRDIRWWWLQKKLYEMPKDEFESHGGCDVTELCV